MLRRNRHCMLASQNFKIMQEQYLSALNMSDDNISLLLPFADMCNANPQMLQTFAEEAYKLFYSKGWCIPTDYTSSQGYYQIGVYGLFMSNLVFGYDIHQKTMKLYTSSIDLINEFVGTGRVVAKSTDIQTELAHVTEVLCGEKRVRNSIKKKNTIQVVRLDPEYRGNSLVFKMSVPRSQLDLDVTQIFPFDVVNTAMFCLHNLIQDRMIRVTSGDKVRIITKNLSILSMIYGETRARSLLMYGYDAKNNTFYAPSVGASVYSSGVTNIDITAVDKLEVVNGIAELDLSEIYLNVESAPEYVICKLDYLDMSCLNDLLDRYNVDANTNNEAYARTVLRAKIEETPAYVTYEIMKQCAYLDVSEYKRLAKGLRVNQTKPEAIEIPNTVQELSDLMKKGVYIVTLFNRSGKYKTVTVTNSVKDLQRIYGEGYYTIYESTGNRIRALCFGLKKKFPNGVSDADLIKGANKYRVIDIFEDIFQRGFARKDIYTAEDIDTLANRGCYMVDENKTVIKHPDKVLVRNCECKAEHQTYDYYKNLDIRAIKSIMKIDL